MKHQILITTTFTLLVEREAPTAEQARKLVEQEIWDGKIDTIDSEPDTEVEIVD